MQSENRQQQLDITAYWDIIWRRKILIITLAVVSVLITMIVSLLLPNYYKSETVVLCIGTESGGLGAALAASPLAGAIGSFGGSSGPADKVLVYLKSRTVAEMVIRKFDLMRVFNESKWDAAKGTWKNPERPPFMVDVIKKLNKDVASFKKAKEGTITITVEWKDPNLAAEIANYYVVALAEFMKDKSVVSTVQIVDRAITAEKKSWPLIKDNMLTAGILSLMVGVLVAFLLEYYGKKNNA
jgi:tyrosine-protein kinase Etk/Wzc